MDNEMTKYGEIRERFYSVWLGGESIWVKKLRTILNSDIHEKSLGCKISNTHVKIDKIHLDTFYEAQILFSHAYWVERFALELFEKIEPYIGDKDVVLIGYETYIEPVLYSLKKRLKSFNKLQKKKVEYCIFEEPKYTFNQKTKENELRYFENIKDIAKSSQIIFICGIATTLSTYIKMRNFFLNEKLKIIASKDISLDLTYLSLIQVFPKVEPSDNVVGSFDFDSETKIVWDKNEKRTTIITDGKESLVVHYIVDVECGWYKSEDCKLCYPDDVLAENAIIATSETSVVPMQMIFLNGKKSTKISYTTDTDKTGLKVGKKFNSYSLDFFKKDDHNSFIFKDYIYYGHTVRGQHHFQYYIRTNHLFADILHPRNEAFEKVLDEFLSYCKKVKENIKEKSGELDDSVHVIISPSHFSSKIFCNAINEFVFDSKAHIISFDPQKEYRSNFETKYSNYAYFLEQIKGTEQSKDKKLLFYFVDDQLITGATIHRTHSLVENLISENGGGGDNVKIWNGIFVVVSRISNSSKRDYIEDTNAYYPLFEINVPSIRNYGDSCPLCKMRAAAEDFVKKSVLDCNAHHWVEKQHWNKVRSLSEAKTEKNEKLTDRQFRRFYCENIFTKSLKTDYENRIKDEVFDFLATEKFRTVKDIKDFIEGRSEWKYSCLHKNLCKSIERKRSVNNAVDGLKSELKSYCFDTHETLINIITEILEENFKEQRCEYLISCIKVLSRPFLYYRENIKFATLKILIGLIEGLIKSGNNVTGTSKEIELYQSIKVTFNNKYEIYNLLVILINSLASIDSAYLLHTSNLGQEGQKIKIKELYDFVCNLFGGKDDELCKQILSFTENSEKIKITDGDYQIDVDSFYLVVLNAVKRIILGIGGEAKSKKIDYIIDKVDDVYRHNGERTIYDYSLIKAIYLENSVQIITEINSATKENLIDKYKGISNQLKKEFNDRAKINIDFYYYDSSMNQSGGFDVFYIDQSAKRVSLQALLKSEKQKDQNKGQKNFTIEIKQKLNSIGFYETKNKFLVKLHHYTEEDIAQEKNGEIVSNKEVFMLITFNENCLDSSIKLRALREILKYRYSLTGIIRNDIDSGAIMSAIQAQAFNSYLESGKISSHGAMKDWQKLIELIYDHLQQQNRNERKQGYELLNIFMNLCISFGAGREVLIEYFGSLDTDLNDPLKIDVGFYISKGNSRIIKNYLDDITDRKFAAALFEKGNDSNIELPKVIINIASEKDVTGADDGWALKNYPVLFRPDVNAEDDGIYQIFLLGFIDVFIRNAIKHTNDAIQIEIKGSAENYEVKISNGTLNKINRRLSTLLKTEDILQEETRQEKPTTTDNNHPCSENAGSSEEETARSQAGHTRLFLDYLHRKETANMEFYSATMKDFGNEYQAIINVGDYNGTDNEGGKK